MSARGSIKQAENGTWSFTIDVPSKELGPNGKPKRKQTKRRGFRTKKQAQTELTKLLSEIDNQDYVAPQDQTLGAYLEHIWLPAIEHTVKESTFQSYHRMLRRHVISRPIGATKLQKVTGPMLNAHYALLMTGTDEYTPLSRKTVRYCSTVLHRAFKDAVRWQAVARNPVEASDPPAPGDQKVMSIWTPAQLNAFLEVAREHRHSALWWVIATTGMRRGEGLGLKWGDVDWERGTVTIKRALIASDEGNRTWSTPKSAAGFRTVVLDEETLAVLRAHRARQNEEKLLLGAGYRDEDLITCQADGSTIGPTRITEQFGRLLRKAGLPHIRLHDLRHTQATHALEAGINPRVVQERLGHSHVSVTLGIYSHVDTTMQQDASDRLAAMRRAARESGAG